MKIKSWNAHLKFLNSFWISIHLFIGLLNFILTFSLHHFLFNFFLIIFVTLIIFPFLFQLLSIWSRTGTKWVDQLQIEIANILFTIWTVYFITLYWENSTVFIVNDLQIFPEALSVGIIFPLRGWYAIKLHIQITSDLDRCFNWISRSMHSMKCK